jgi:hypothetical protein
MLLVAGFSGKIILDRRLHIHYILLREAPAHKEFFLKNLWPPLDMDKDLLRLSKSRLEIVRGVLST